MSGPFRILPGDEPDEIDMELWSLGEVDDPEVARRIEEAARSTGVLAELAAAREAWADRPPLPVGPARRSWVPWQGWALAALALLVVGGVASWVVPGPEQLPGVRAMGGLAVDVGVTREGQTLTPPWQLAAGDRLHLSLTSPDDGWLEVVTVQEDGGVSVLLAGERVALHGGEPFSLDGAVELDDHRGREWLVVNVVERPRTDEQVAQAVRARLPVPASDARSWVLEVTRQP